MKLFFLLFSAGVAELFSSPLPVFLPTSSHPFCFFFNVFFLIIFLPFFPWFPSALSLPTSLSSSPASSFPSGCSPVRRRRFLLSVPAAGVGTAGSQSERSQSGAGGQHPAGERCPADKPSRSRTGKHRADGSSITQTL